MSERLALAAVALAALSGLPGAFRPREGRAGERAAAFLLGAGSLLGLAAAVAALLGRSSPIDVAWPVPGGRFAVEVDALSALFVAQVSLLAGLGAIFGLEYWPQARHPDNGRKVRCFYGLVTAGMLLQVVATNALVFLLGWELMALSAFVLIMTEDEKASVRAVSYVYLAATRLGTLSLFAMFALLAAAGGSLDYEAWPAALAAPLGGAIFVLGLIGFGLKAGVMPLHVWLPGAHASTPSHVSAVMSGVLIKMGIYGLVRLTALCAHPPAWYGHTLLAVGVVSGVLGVAFAIGQHDLKRLLAYHSVENIGIICMGLGVAVLGRASGDETMIVLGLAGALLHTWNHGLFKALLFLGAGSVLHATGIREIDRLGGLWRGMPRSAAAFLVGAIAICGLPPLNGLVSELLVYLGLFQAGFGRHGRLWLAGALAAPALALIGGLAIACFVKVFAAVFLGEARTEDAARAHDPGRGMLAPMALLGLGCFAVALAAPLIAPILDRAVAAWRGSASPVTLGAAAPLAAVSLVNVCLLGAAALVGWRLARRGRPAAKSVGTWDCGYAVPTARMQYTASSFADTLVRLFGWALRPHRRAPSLTATFPGPADFHSHVPDTVLDRGIVPAFSLAARVFDRLHLLHRGNVHVYLLYIVVTLLALLLWR